MRYTTVLLDLDHTLLDSDTSELLAFDETMHSVGVAEPQIHFADYAAINRAYWASVERGEITPDQVRVARFQEFAEFLGLAADATSMAATFVEGLGRHGELYPGSTELLENLRSSTSLGLVTNGLGDVQRSRIERLGLERYFDVIVISGEVGVSKPDPAIFELAFAGLGFPPSDTVVMVGDSLSSDMRGAANAGIAGCWYNPDRRPADPAVPLTHEITALGDLAPLVAGRLSGQVE